MWTRAELKETGRNAFKANYWRTVLVSVIAMVIAGAGGSSIGAGGSSGAGAGTMQEAGEAAGQYGQQAAYRYVRKQGGSAAGQASNI
jgi:hypothetical protein